MGILWEAAYASAFQIQVSNDNATWTTVYSTTTGTGGNQTFTVSATARYIRVYATARATQCGDSIFEFDVYGLTTTAAGHRRQRQRRQRGLPLGRLHRAGRPAGPAGAQHHGPVRRGHPGSPATAPRPTSARSPAIPNLCIKPMNMEDGPSGVGDGNGGVTAFPDGENAAATWDPALIQQEGAAMGAEFAGKGVNVSLGPTTNLVRDPRWGRTYETYGEDPYLAGQITSAEVEGLQSQGVMADGQARRRLRPGAVPERRQQRDGQPAGAGGALPGAVPDRHRAVRAGLVHVLLRRGQRRRLLRRTPTCCRTGSTTQANYGGFVTSDWGAAGNAVADAEGGMDIAMPFSDASDVHRRPHGRHAEPGDAQRGRGPDPDPDVRLRHVRQPGRPAPSPPPSPPRRTSRPRCSSARRARSC